VLGAAGGGTCDRPARARAAIRIRTESVTRRRRTDTIRAPLATVFGMMSSRKLWTSRFLRQIRPVARSVQLAVGAKIVRVGLGHAHDDAVEPVLPVDHAELGQFVGGKCGQQLGNGHCGENVIGGHGPWGPLCFVVHLHHHGHRANERAPAPQAQRIGRLFCPESKDRQWPYRP
jgi:hypothetical protein